MKTPSVLVIGGTSGLGLALALSFQKEGGNVFIAGRHNPKRQGLTYIKINIDSNSEKISTGLDSIIKATQPIGTLIYAAGFFEEGPIVKLSDRHIKTMLNIGLLIPAMLISKILRKQKKIKNLILITSTSQWIPRPKEPVYAATKAALAMLGNSISLDGSVDKTLIIGPGAMKTTFWKKGRREGNLLDPRWIAKTTSDLHKKDFSYKLVRILRNPTRIQIIKKR